MWIATDFQQSWNKLVLLIGTYKFTVHMQDLVITYITHICISHYTKISDGNALPFNINILKIHIITFSSSLVTFENHRTGVCRDLNSLWKCHGFWHYLLDQSRYCTIYSSIRTMIVGLHYITMYHCFLLPDKANG